MPLPRTTTLGHYAPAPYTLRLPLLALIAIAQVAPSQAVPNNVASSLQQPGTVSTLQSNVSEVSLELLVRDRKNRLVPDLTAADLTVTDDGTPVKLSNFRLVEGNPASPRMVTLVLDHLDPAQSKNARTIAAKLLKAIPDQGFKFAVMRTDGRLRLILQYTADRALVEHAMELATEGTAAELSTDSAEAEKKLLAQAALPGSPVASGSPLTVSAADRESARMTYAALTASQQMVVNQTPLQLAVLMALAQAQRAYSGRKVMVYFTAGLDADSRATEMIKTAAGEANRSGVSLYAIDMSAIRLDANENLAVTAAMGSVMTSNHFNPITPAATQANPNTGVVTPGMAGQIAENLNNLEMNDLHAAPSPIGRLAEATGGRYIPAEVNMNKPIHQLVEDLTTYYVATYTPPIGDYDGSFRAIAVKPLRTDVSIRTRSGYFALPPSDASCLRPFEMPLLSLLKQPLGPTEFSFASRVVQLGSLPGGLTQEVVVEAPISELEIKKDTNSGLFSVQANVLAQIVDSTGTVVEQFSQELRRHGALDTVDVARGDVLSFQRPFVAAPGSYTLNVAVVDALSGKAAVAKTLFQLTPSRSGPSLSDIIVVRRVDPVTPDRDKDDSLGDPLRSSTGEVVPNLAGAVQAGTKDVSLFFMIHPGQALGKPALEITVSRDGHPIGRAPLVFREAADGGAVPYFSTIGTRSMSAGEYVATARLTQGGQSVERSVSLRIEGTARTQDAHIELAVADPANPRRASETEMYPINASELAEASAAASEALPPLVVTPAGPGASLKSPTEIDHTLNEARERALAYATGLPNFLCVETTNRSIDSSGTGKWKHQDSFSELLTYRNHAESRRLMEVNGHEDHTAPDDLKGMVSHGEFGGILNAIFDPSAKATLAWKQSGFLGGERVDLFEYHVAARNSSFGLTGDNNWQLNAAFHGVVSVDSATLGVRQLTIIADDLPPDFSIHASAIRVDYDYIAINGHDYLLPTRATISLRRHKHEGVLNEIEFRDYRRFGSKSRMLPVGP
jgi:VWFA-related protein